MHREEDPTGLSHPRSLQNHPTPPPSPGPCNLFAFLAKSVAPGNGARGGDCTFGAKELEIQSLIPWGGGGGRGMLRGEGAEIKARSPIPIKSME